MAKKQYFLIIDTETTMPDCDNLQKVYDFGAVLCDRQGVIVKELGVIVNDFKNLELFHDKAANDIWGYEGLLKRKANYQTMLQSGQRMLASVGAINRWLDRVKETYNPALTAYNLAFDADKLGNSGIDISTFTDKFCLWYAAGGNFAGTKKYREFCLANHYFGNRTVKTGSMTMRTNAEVMAHFLTGNELLEPHTGLEDARDFERPILAALLKKRNWRDNIKPYAYRDFQLRDNFQAK